MALIGSSNLTDGGLRSNREATIRLNRENDVDDIEELRKLFQELWNSAQVLTAETLKRFTDEYHRVKIMGSSADSLIENAVGIAEPMNISVASLKKSAERNFLDRLRRQIYERYQPAFNEVAKLLTDNQLRRAALAEVGVASETNRFLNWVRVTFAPGEDAWEATPLRGADERRSEILRLGREWTITGDDKIPEDYTAWLLQVRRVFDTAPAIEEASKDLLIDGLMSTHAFNEQLRFVKGGKANLADAFWTENNDDVRKVKRTLTHLVHGGGEFCERLHDVLYDHTRKLRYFGKFCALELCGTVRPDHCPPMNGRMAKALRYLGFDVPGY